MKLYDLLDQKSILINLKSKDKTGALTEMVTALGKTGKIKDSGQVLNLLLERESTSSTGLGEGIAIPHARVDGLEKPVVLLAVSRTGIDFKAVDNLPVRVFFLFLTPTEQTGLHLQLLSEASKILTDKKTFDSLLRAKTTQDIFTLLLSRGKGEEAFFPLSADEIYIELDTDASGLSEAEAQRRLEKTGSNVLRAGKKKPMLLRFAENFYNLFAILLWVGGAFAFVADMPELGWAIFAVIIINAVFSFWQEFKAEKALEALRKLIPQLVMVLRDGQEKEIPAENLVPGDIILLEEGNSISADARLIEAFDMRVDNSALTGESRPIYKIAETIEDGKEFLWTELPTMVFAGTTVTSGAGKAIVVATGMNTEIGRIASLTQELKEEKSPLQHEIEKVTKIVTVLAVGMGVAFFFLGTYIGKLSLAEAFIFAIGIIVANVPEGLLPTVTLSLAMAVQRMVKRHVFVKKLSSVETLGCTNVICTDKTGTLTTNEISATKLWVNNRTIDISGTRYEPVGNFFYKGVRLSTAEMKENGMFRLFDVCVLCNNANLIPPKTKEDRWSIVGDPTEAAMLVMAAKGGEDVSIRKKAFQRIGHLPFESVRKRMTSVNINSNNEGPVAYVKGAPRETIQLCAHIYLNGKVEALTEAMRNIILKENDSMSSEGLRVLAAAYRPVGFSEGFTIENTEKELIFLGLVGMMDPPRAEVPEAIALCHRAGIRVVMITGDYGLTALSIAKKIGLVHTKNPQVVTGQELSGMDEKSLGKLLQEKEVIFARVSPEHKMMIVSAFKDMGKIVAVTGDGVNDAPALKRADIGVAMGVRGSDVAKEAAAMILTDDNFASIVAAIEEGRAVYANIKKFITYIFASNIPEIIPFIAFVMFRIPLPLTVMQILAVDLGTDIVPALGLGIEAPEPGIMDKPPRARNKSLLDMNLLVRAYGFLGVIEAIACMAGFYFIYYEHGWRPGMEMASAGTIYLTATTMSLAGIVATQIGNVFACRTERESVFKVGFFKNKLVLWGIASELTIITALVYTPFLQKIFGLAPISLKEWGFLFAFTPVLLLLEEGRKWIVRRRGGPGEGSREKVQPERKLAQELPEFSGRYSQELIGLTRENAL